MRKTVGSGINVILPPRTSLTVCGQWRAPSPCDLRKGEAAGCVSVQPERLPGRRGGSACAVVKSWPENLRRGGGRRKSAAWPLGQRQAGV